MEDFTKVVRLGTKQTYSEGRWYSIYCKIEYKEGRLSITGVEGPTWGGNSLGGCGQIVMGLREEVAQIKPAPGWDHDKINHFFEMWNQYHLNNMQGGSPAQTAWLKEHKEEAKKHPMDHFNWLKAELAKAGLDPDPNYLHKGEPYSYGTAWLRIEVPAEVIEFLRGLPDTDKEPAWV